MYCRPPALALIATCVLLVAGCGAAEHFIGRSGRELTLNGKHWRFIGFNDYELVALPGHTRCGRSVDSSALDSIMTDAKDSGASTIRTWFFQSYYDMTNSGGKWRAITPTWAAFDRVLRAAAAHQLKLIPVLVNEWPNCEPSSSNKDLAFFRSGYSRSGQGYPLSFRRYAITVARHYAHNGTIAFWQLGNELQVASGKRCDERRSAGALRAFADDMTSAIESVDSNHLVSLGTTGNDECGLAGRDYEYVHAGRIDLCEYHDYGQAALPMPESLQARIAQCDALHKPTFVGESGIPADTSDYGTSTGKITATSLRLRAGFFDAKLTAAFAAGAAGYLIWDKRQDASNAPINYAFGRYMVGPSSRFFDPTNEVTAALSRSFGYVPGSLRFGFEDGGLDGWRLSGGSKLGVLSNTAVEAWSGNRSLAIRLSNGSRSAAVLSTETGGLSSGDTVTYHVYLPSLTAADLRVAPYVLGAPGNPTSATPERLQPGWNTVQWRIPSGTSTPLRVVGIRIIDARGSPGPLLLDAVMW